MTPRRCFGVVADFFTLGTMSQKRVFGKRPKALKCQSRNGCEPCRR